MHHGDLGIQLGLAYAAFVDWLNAEMAAAGFDDLGARFGYLFRALADGPATLTDLADGLRMSTQGAAKILTEMQARGYVRRVAHPTDGRARLIELTDRGRLALEAAHGLHQRYEQMLGERIGVRAVSTLRRALADILELGDVDPASRLLRPL